MISTVSMLITRRSCFVVYYCTYDTVWFACLFAKRPVMPCQSHLNHTKSQALTLPKTEKSWMLKYNEMQPFECSYTGYFGYTCINSMINLYNISYTCYVYYHCISYYILLVQSFPWWKPEVPPCDRSWISGDGAHSKAVRAYDEAVDPFVRVSDWDWGKWGDMWWDVKHL